MMINASFVNEQVILVASAPMHSVTAVMNLTTLHKTAQTQYLHQEHHATKTGLIPGNDTPTPKGTDNTQPTMGTNIGDISTNHNHATIPTLTGAGAVTEGTQCPPHPATTVANAALWLMDAPITTCTMTHPIGIVTLHPALTTSSTNITYATIPWTGVGLTPATLTILHMEHSQ